MLAYIYLSFLNCYIHGTESHYQRVHPLLSMLSRDLLLHHPMSVFFRTFFEHFGLLRNYAKICFLKFAKCSILSLVLWGKFINNCLIISFLISLCCFWSVPFCYSVRDMIWSNHSPLFFVRIIHINRIKETKVLIHVSFYLWCYH